MLHRGLTFFTLAFIFIGSPFDGVLAAQNEGLTTAKKTKVAMELELELEVMLKRDRFAKPSIERDAWLVFSTKIEGSNSVGKALKARVHSQMAISYFYTKEYRKAWIEIQAAERLLEDLTIKASDQFRYETWAYASLISTDLKEIERAKLYARRAMEDAVAVFGEDSAAAGLAHNAAGYFGYKGGDLKQAQRGMCNAAKLAEKHLSLSDPMVTNNYVSCGATMYFNDDEKAAETINYAASIAYENLPSDHLVMSLALNGSGAILFRLGRYAETEKILQRQIVIERENRGEKSPELFNPISLLAEVVLAQGRITEAVALQRHATAYAHQMDAGGNPFARGNSSIKLATLLDSLGPNTESHDLYLSGISELKADLEPNDAWIYLAELAYADHVFRNKDQKEGLEAAHNAFAELSKVYPESHRERLSWAIRIAEMMARSGNPKQAMARALPAAEFLENQLLDVSVKRQELISFSTVTKAGFSSLAWTALLGRDHEAAVKSAQLSLLSELSIANSNLALRAAAKNQGFERQIQEIRKTRGELRTLRADLAKAEASGGADILEKSKDLRSSQLSLDRLERELSSKFPEFSKLSKPNLASMDEIQSNLSENQAVILPIPVSGHSLTMIVTQDDVFWGSEKNEGAMLSAQIKLLLSDIDAARLAENANEASFDAQAAYKVFKHIFPSNLYEQISNKTDLLFPASGAIAKLPPEIMLTKPVARDLPVHNLPWLIKEKSISIFSDLGDSRKLQKRPNNHQKFAGIGAPTFTGRQSVNAVSKQIFRGGVVSIESLALLPALPRAALELKQIGAAFDQGDSTIITGDAATEKAVREMDFSNHSVVAFATHGLVSGEINGLAEPALAFTPSGTDDPKNDGLLTATDIAQMSINADWVILSACNSGGGNDNSAPTYSGLARAFRLAGAGSLLLSHWAVRDDAAAFLTVETIKNAESGMGRAEALRQAQLKLMADRSIAGSAHPAIWAPFILINN